MRIKRVAWSKFALGLIQQAQQEQPPARPRTHTVQEADTVALPAVVKLILVAAEA